MIEVVTVDDDVEKINRYFKLFSEPGNAELLFGYLGEYEGKI